MRGTGAADRVQRFVGWLDAFGSALERNDLAALDALFALEASYRPTPFMPVVRGRRKIRKSPRIVGLAGRRPASHSEGHNPDGNADIDLLGDDLDAMPAAG
jgi:hypothetical protein